jgi:uncharacterized protein with HEPN domain
MIHRYFEVNLDVLWSIIKKDLPKLRDKLKEYELLLDKELKGVKK